MSLLSKFISLTVVYLWVMGLWRSSNFISPYIPNFLKILTNKLLIFIKNILTLTITNVILAGLKTNE